MERAYYIVSPGELRTEVLKVQQMVEEAKKRLFDNLKLTAVETGCNSALCLMQDGQCVGLVFDRTPPPDSLCGWKKVDPERAWWPKQNTKKGKEIAKRFSDILPTTLLVSAIPEHLNKWLLEGNVAHKSDLLISETLDEKNYVILTIPYNEMSMEGPELTAEDKIYLTRIAPVEFSRLLQSHNERVRQDKAKVEAKPL